MRKFLLPDCITTNRVLHSTTCRLTKDQLTLCCPFPTAGSFENWVRGLGVLAWFLMDISDLQIGILGVCQCGGAEHFLTLDSNVYMPTVHEFVGGLCVRSGLY